jgi:hypothetical protein
MSVRTEVYGVRCAVIEGMGCWRIGGRSTGADRLDSYFEEVVPIVC